MKEIKLIKDLIVSFIEGDIDIGWAIHQIQEAATAFYNFYNDWQINKVIRFLYGLQDLSLEERSKLSDKLFGSKHKETNAERLVDSLFKADSSKKISFIINATRSLLLLDDELSAEMYFRIIRAIVDNQIEDLEFLKNNILSKRDFTENDNVFALSHSGLMRQISWDAFRNLEQQKYIFSSLAFKVDRFALSVENKEHISLLKDREKENRRPEFTVPAVFS